VQLTSRDAGSAERLEAGQSRHVAHGRRVAIQRWLVRLAVLLLAAAAAVLWAMGR
jgi:hypothetical protein